MSTETSIATLMRAGFSRRQANAIIGAFTTAPVADAVGGGEPKGIVIGTAAQWTTTSPAGGRRVMPDHWTFETMGGDPDTEVTTYSADESYGWGYQEEGWYQVVIQLGITFTAVVAALPTYVRVRLQTYDGVTCIQEFPCMANAGFAGVSSAGSRDGYGAQGQLVSPIYWHPGAVAGNGQSAHRLQIAWPGDATALAADIQSAPLATAQITRLA